MGVSTDEAVEETYGLAELAQMSGVSERTIRYYQGEHLLPRPAKRGRDAVYGPEHRERLKLVSDLRDRGLNLQTIRELVTSGEPTEAVRTWLGIDATLRAPWSSDMPRTMSHEELNEKVTTAVPGRPGLIGELAAAGYTTRQGRDEWTVSSPALLDAALRLQAAGIDVDVSAQMRDLLRRRLAKAVDDTVELLVKRAGTGFADGATAEEVAVALEALRPAAADTVNVLLGHEVDRALAHLAETGVHATRRSSRRR